MQQTEKYKLNLIEPSDPFLPEGLNENTQKIEEVLSENLGAVRSTVDALVKNVGAGGKNARIAWGFYDGNGTYGEGNSIVLTVDFYPAFLFTGSSRGFTDSMWSPCFLMRGLTTTEAQHYGAGYLGVTWLDDGVKLSGSSAASANNELNHRYFYIIIGYDENA